MLAPLLLAACVATTVDDQRLNVAIDPAAHTLMVSSRISTRDAGPLVVVWNDRIEVDSILVDGKPASHRDAPPRDGRRRIEIDVGAGASTVELRGHGRFEEDVASGERPGQIHNFSVDAHIGDQGVFLSEGAAWHPRPIDGAGHAILHPIAIEIAPVDGWAFVASGNPVDGGPLDQPRWSWRTPRPVDGLALAGNRHQLHGVTHETKEGPVEIVMHVPAEHAQFAEMYLKAAAQYLDLFVPRLGAFPYKRFSIVENFFSSGFAYPGFTLLGPQVVSMAPRSLVPGYLDHEMLHNWWGNGVYVSDSDGNWCEGLTSYGANYGRRFLEDGPDAARAYRRDTLMRLSTDPKEFDNGPLGTFGSADPSRGGPDRFVGYDKGAFVFFMLEDVLARAAGKPSDEGNAIMWACLRRFAQEHLGKDATWKDLQAAFESAAPQRPAGWLDGYMKFWVRERSAPSTVVEGARDPARAFAAQIPAATSQAIDVAYRNGGASCEIDPDFRIYRTLPERQLVPTIAGTTGPGGLHVETSESRKEVESFVPQLEPSDKGENLVIIGAAALAKHADALARSGDPIELRDGAFTVAGKTWNGANNAVLHTMHDPDRPGRYITVFASNGDAGWSRLRLIRFYGRDTTIVWDGDKVIERRAYEPDRQIPTSRD
ncbi:MAG: hypothetical protein U0572_01355 [Phycisphaerales bacterium]